MLQKPVDAEVLRADSRRGQEQQDQKRDQRQTQLAPCAEELHLERVLRLAGHFGELAQGIALLMMEQEQPSLLAVKRLQRLAQPRVLRRCCCGLVCTDRHPAARSVGRFALIDEDPHQPSVKRRVAVQLRQVRPGAKQRALHGILTFGGRQPAPCGGQQPWPQGCGARFKVFPCHNRPPGMCFCKDRRAENPLRNGRGHHHRTFFRGAPVQHAAAAAAGRGISRSAFRFGRGRGRARRAP